MEQAGTGPLCHPGDEALWAAELRGGDGGAGGADPSGMRQGRLALKLMEGSCPSPLLPVGPEVAVRHREELDLGLAMAEHKKTLRRH